MNSNPHIGYKLLTQNMTSHGRMGWEIGKLETASQPGTEMCTNQVLHYYSHPLLAVFANPILAGIENPRLFEIEVDACVNSDNLKCASKSQRLIKELELPQLNDLQRQFVAISCAKLLPGAPTEWTSWADKWLSGEDRTLEAEKRVHAHAYAYAYAYAHACACAHAYACAHARAHVRAHAHAHAYAYVHAHARAHAHVRAYACARACAYAESPTSQIITFLEESLTNLSLQTP